MPITSNTPQQAVLADREAPTVWSIKEIARFYRRSLRQASSITSDASFPRPIVSEWELAEYPRLFPDEEFLLGPV